MSDEVKIEVGRETTPDTVRFNPTLAGAGLPTSPTQSKLNILGMHEYPVSSKEYGIIFDSIGPQFSINIFIWEFVVHMLYPFFIWSSPISHGWWPIQNNALYFYLNHGSSVVVYLMLLCAYLSQHVTSNEWVIPFMFYTIHRTMVASKYGSLSRTEYK
jgi:hypothetical protein